MGCFEVVTVGRSDACPNVWWQPMEIYRFLGSSIVIGIHSDEPTTIYSLDTMHVSHKPLREILYKNDAIYVTVQKVDEIFSHFTQL